MHRRRRLTTILIGITYLVYGGVQLEAQVRLQPVPTPPPELGIRGLYDFDLEAWGVGAQFRHPLRLGMSVVVSGEYVFAERGPGTQVQADLSFGGLLPGVYFGAGAFLAHRGFVFVGVPTSTKETKIGFGAHVGLALPRMVASPVRPYVEARWTFASGYDTQFALGFGLNVLLGTPPRPPARRR